MNYKIKVLALGAMIACAPLLHAQSMMLKNYAVGSGAFNDINRGDFNNDGIPDVVFCSSQLSIGVALGNADGTLQAVKNSGTTTNCFGVAVGDFNHDGKLDVAAAGLSNTVEILLGRGDGTFSTLQVLNAPSAQSVVAGDFNGDGNLDLAVANGGSELLFFLGNGDGTFQNAIYYPTSQTYVNKVLIGDFDQDGRTDLAFSGSTGASVLFNNGGMKFKEVSVNAGASVVTTGDLNQDGYTDLILGIATDCIQGPKNTYCNQAWAAYRSNGGARTFTQTFLESLGQGDEGLISAAVVDVNGDGINDVVATLGYYALAVWLGKPDGTYNTTSDLYPLDTDAEPSAMVALDINRDGRPDFVTVNPGSIDVAVSVLLNAYPRASCATYTASTSVTGCQPANATYNTSPVAVVANSYDATHPVTAMQIYVDNALKYTVGSNKLNTTLALGNGSHSLVLKGWDSSGASFKTSRNINVYSGTPGTVCGTTGGKANICLPATGATLTSPVRVLAAGYPAWIPTAAQLYVDGVLKYNDTTGANYMDTSISFASGSHNLVFKVWDADGNTVQTSKTITVH